MKHIISVTVRNLAIVTAINLAIIFSFFYAIARVSANDSTDKLSQLKLFTEVINIVEKSYVEDIDFKKVVEGAIKGMLVALDPHSSFLNKDEYNELKVDTSGEFAGLGIEITMKDGVLTVVSPIEDSPAFKAGIMAGDKIFKIGDEFTKNLTMTEAVKRMRGERGTDVSISILRPGKRYLIPMKITREIIKVQSVKYRELGSNIHYIRLSQFQDDSSKEFEEKLDLVSKDTNIKGLIIDLRNNPGGLLNQAVKVSDLFLKDGLIVYTKGRIESQNSQYVAKDNGDEPNFPIIILINSGSASAAEILSGTLQDAKRALIVGQESFGKGSVQTVLPTDNGGAVRLTTSLYYTRAGRSIQGEGIHPDIEILSTKDKLLKDLGDLYELPSKEKDLPGAIKNPKKQSDESAISEFLNDTKVDKKELQKKLEEFEDKLPIGSAGFLNAKLTDLLAEDIQLEKAYSILKNGEYQSLLEEAKNKSNINNSLPSKSE